MKAELLKQVNPRYQARNLTKTSSIHQNLNMFCENGVWSLFDYLDEEHKRIKLGKGWWLTKPDTGTAIVVSDKNIEKSYTLEGPSVNITTAIHNETIKS